MENWGETMSARDMLRLKGGFRESLVSRWRAYWHPQPDELEAKARDGSTADLEILLGEVRALHCRVMRRSPRRRPELVAMLQSTVNAASFDVVKARSLYSNALMRFEQVTQAANQIAFMLGAVAGAALGMWGAYGLIGLSTLNIPWVSGLTDASTIAALCFFGLLGSLTSIFLRLWKLDLRHDDSFVLIALSGIVQPFIALGFVAVVFVVIHGRMLGVQITSSDPSAVLWVAAFLCGFSERFAPAILDSAARLYTSPTPRSRNDRNPPPA